MVVLSKGYFQPPETFRSFGGLQDQPGVELTYFTSGGSGDGGDPCTGLDRFGRIVDQRWRRTSDNSDVDRFKYGYGRASNSSVRMRIWSRMLSIITSGPALRTLPRGRNLSAFARRTPIHPGKSSLSRRLGHRRDSGIPFSLLGLFDHTDEFYDTKLGSNVKVARHVRLLMRSVRILSRPSGAKRSNLDLKQVWFAGVHSDIGGSYAPDSKGRLASDYPLEWMLREAEAAGLSIESHLVKSLKPHSKVPIHRSRRHIYRFRQPLYRPILQRKAVIWIHESVKDRWDQDERYRPRNLVDFVEENGWPSKFES